MTKLSFQARVTLFEELMTLRQRQLLESAQVLTEDFGFKEAVGIGEAETVRSALDNHGARIGADVAFLLDLQGNVLTGTSQLAGGGTAFPQLFERAQRQGYAASTAVLGGDAFQLVLLPVRAPVRVAWVALEFRIDASTVTRLHSLIGAEVTFFDSASPATVYASSRDGGAVLARMLVAETDTVHRDAAGEFLSLVPTLDGVSKEVAVALQLSLDEALLRWRHSEHGLLRPDEFIPLAEQAGQIGLVTQWVLDRSSRQMAVWEARGEKLHVSVNLSAVDLLDAELPAQVRRLLTRHRVAAERLTLEITETAVVRDEAGALAALASLRDCGVRLSIDDFGVGHSSLAQLKRLPVHELKIDKAFVFPLGSSEEDEMIVRSIIELGHNLGLEVCAEGVETDAVRRLLGAQDCDTIQGYLLSPPLECDAFRDWYARRYETA